MREVYTESVKQAADVVDEYLPKAKKVLANQVQEDHYQYQALEGLSVGVKHTEGDYTKVPKTVAVWTPVGPVRREVPKEDHLNRGI